MSDGLNESGLNESGKLEDIDLDRVVVDAAYRRRVITRLRRDRQQAEALCFKGPQDLVENVIGDED